MSPEHRLVFLQKFLVIFSQMIYLPQSKYFSQQIMHELQANDPYREAPAW